ncbi:response regulator receiver protein [Candidatus Nitrosarchaeum limnium SFB1]|jgi:DNA-binding response OmpR family regulator|uniref:Response regulator receiver protein n=1 Tax=Candidatus Nitrosarchaeum limnium SFB1 TaxID=886738 RepID=F3KID3_9ARCH|nr:response regulator receiver protein [Candidatus Nitrosarchaeum limnium SFB1]
MKILHIDDSPEISKVFSDVLKTKNHDFESITDGKVGLGMVLKNQYDLILLDMCMPNYNGIDFLLDLKKEKSSEIQKTVIVSSLELDEHQTEFLTKLGVKAIKQKPISVQNLLEQTELKIMN